LVEDDQDQRQAAMAQKEAKDQDFDQDYLLNQKRVRESARLVEFITKEAPPVVRWMVSQCGCTVAAAGGGSESSDTGSSDSED
jgi:hypothetical protein